LELEKADWTAIAEMEGTPYSLPQHLHLPSAGYVAHGIESYACKLRASSLSYQVGSKGIVELATQHAPLILGGWGLSHGWLKKTKKQKEKDLQL